MRDTRRRLKRYTYGDQWGDIVTDGDGRRVVESEWIKQSGRKPITNNLIRRLVKTIVGRYRETAVNSGWYDTRPESFDSLRLLEELDSRLLEEFLISGMAIQRVADDNPLQGFKADVENVNPDSFFCNDFRDPRGNDIDCIGMLHDMSPAEIMMRFGHGDGALTESLARIIAKNRDMSIATAGDTRFFNGAKGRIRVIEVWTREYSGEDILRWKVRWFTGAGELLDSYESPWGHGCHPFVLKFYPLTDGEVHSFVEDVVDQQRYINRIIVLIDRILSVSAKGVLLFPLKQKPGSMSWEDVGRRWAAPDGVIPVNNANAAMPTQISGTSGDMSAYRLLEMELKLFDQTAGVGSALTGMSDNGNRAMGNEHYQAQVQNATIALADIFRTFRSHITGRNVRLKSLTSKKQQDEKHIYNQDKSDC